MIRYIAEMHFKESGMMTDERFTALAWEHMDMAYRLADIGRLDRVTVRGDIPLDDADPIPIDLTFTP